MKKNLIFGLIFCFLIVFPMNAVNISFLVIETGASEYKQASQYSMMWEDGLLEVFFELGHIVSNAPIMRIDQKPEAGFPYEAEMDYENARNGGMEYFLIAILEHPGIIPDENTKPKNICLRLFNTKSHQMLKEQLCKDTSANTIKDEYENIKRAITNMAVEL